MKNISYPHIASLIKSARKSAVPGGLSQRELSEKLGYKNGQFISNIERGLCSLPLEKIDRLITVLNISQKELKTALMNDFEHRLDSVFEDQEESKTESVKVLGQLVNYKIG